ncbi:MAG: DNA cytosine methyltransferase, partial [Anaerolineales bacterium]|nr:DNA cytosine methyltransferase [Anaerolineales bacterium]
MTYIQTNLPFTSIQKHYSPPFLQEAQHPHTAVEFFAGIGLVRLGLEKAGWRIVLANDFNAAKFNA